MLKKIIGIYSIIYGAIMMWGSYADKSATSDFSVAPLMVVTGIFLVIFDNVYKKSYVEGFVTRNAQRIVMIILIIIWITLFIITAIGIVALSAAGVFTTLGAYLLSYGSIIITLIPGFALMRLFDKYSKPYKVCRNYFLTNEQEISYYLSNKKAFKDYSKNEFVLASDVALFFPKLFCLIPFKKIKSVENKRSLDGKAVVFTLKNGKKFKVYTKQYDDIMAAIQANQ